MSQSLITDQDCARVNTTQRSEAELLGIQRRLSNLAAIEPFLKRAGEDPETYFRTLTARKKELVGKRKDTHTSDQLSLLTWKIDEAEIIERLLFTIDPWMQLGVPTIVEGINEQPGNPGTSGSIVTAGPYSGGLGYGGMVENDNSPVDERFWIHNWKCTIALPSAGINSRISYRFSVSSECHVYLDPVASGSVMAFVTVGTTPDIGRSITNWNTVGWPVNATLPSSSHNFSGDVPVSGHISVASGKTAAIGLIFGVIVSAAAGYVQFTWGNFGTHITGQSGASAYGKIEYRYDPEWLLIAVKDIAVKLGS
jgi:hypothetical protein